MANSPEPIVDANNDLREITTPKATKIWYHALQNLWPNANFADAVQVLVRSAQVLTKSGVVPLGSTQTVRAAFEAVGV